MTMTTYDSLKISLRSLLAIFLCKALLLISSETPPANEVVVHVPENYCIAVLLPDGYMHDCYLSPTDVYLDNLLIAYRSKHVALAIRHRDSGSLLDYQRIFVPHDFKSTNISPTQIAHSVSEHKIIAVWPSEGAILTSRDIDIQFHVKAGAMLPSDGSAFPSICAKLASLNPKTEDSAFISFVNTTRCNNTSAHLISFHDLPNGNYMAELYSTKSEAIIHAETSQASLTSNQKGLRFTVAATADSSSSQSLKSTNEAIIKPTLLSLGDSSTWTGSEWEDIEKIHILVMSCRSVTRYLEAEVLLKSIFFHFLPNPANTAYGRRAILVVHLVVDSGGKLFFEDVWNNYSLYQHLANVIVILHDIDIVCNRPLDTFLQQARMSQSFHHSGKAGYCRLFIHDYFSRVARGNNHRNNKLPLTINDILLLSNHMSKLQNAKNIDFNNESFLKIISDVLYPQKIIAIESDQLLLTDVRELWDQFKLFTNTTLVAAAENYQPWNESRLFADRLRYEKDLGNNRYASFATSNLQGDENTTFHALSNVNENHGYGIIGGIMMLDLQRMQIVDFLSIVFKCISTFRNSIDDWSWEAKLNDQDIFNVVFALMPKFVTILPCEWNVQLHARTNTLIYCHMDIPGRRHFAVANHTIIRDGGSDHQFFKDRNLKFADVSLNCPESIEKKIFVCTRKAKVLHFMAGTYMDYNFLSYYAFHWDMYKDLSWNIISKI